MLAAFGGIAPRLRLGRSRGAPAAGRLTANEPSAQPTDSVGPGTGLFVSELPARPAPAASRPRRAVNPRFNRQLH